MYNCCCTPGFCHQSYLTWSQLSALILNGTAAGRQLQPWARGLAAALLVTPQSTWHWVGLDCLLLATAEGRRISVGLLRTFAEICYPGMFKLLFQVDQKGCCEPIELRCAPLNDTICQPWNEPPLVAGVELLLHDNERSRSSLKLTCHCLFLVTSNTSFTIRQKNAKFC